MQVMQAKHLPGSCTMLNLRKRCVGKSDLCRMHQMSAVFMLDTSDAPSETLGLYVKLNEASKHDRPVSRP